MSYERAKQKVSGKAPSWIRLLDSAKTVLNDANAAAYNFGNEFTFGGLDAADSLAKKLVPLPESEERNNPMLQRSQAKSDIGQFVQSGAGLAGLIAGGPGNLGQAAGKKLVPKGANVLTRGIRRAIEGGVAGFTQAPEKRKDFGNVSKRAETGALGAGLNVALGPIVEEAMSGFKSFRTGPVKARIQDLRKAGGDLAFEGSEAVKKRAPEVFKDVNAKYGKMLDAVEASGERFTKGDLEEAVENTIQDLGLNEGDIFTGNQDYVRNLRGMIPKTSEEITSPILNASGNAISHTADHSGQALSIRDIKAFISNARANLGAKSHELTVLYKHLGDKIGQQIPGLREANQFITPYYNAARQYTKRLSRSALNRVASGGAPQQETKLLQDLEKAFGTKYATEAESVGKRLTGSRNHLQAIIKRQKRFNTAAKYTGASALVGGVGNLIANAIRKRRA